MCVVKKKKKKKKKEIMEPASTEAYSSLNKYL